MKCIDQMCFHVILVLIHQQNFCFKRLPVTADVHNPISHESVRACPDAGPCGWVRLQFFTKGVFVSICIRHWKILYILCHFKIISMKWLFPKESLKFNVVYHIIYLKSTLSIVFKLPDYSVYHTVIPWTMLK